MGFIPKIKIFLALFVLLTTLESVYLQSVGQRCRCQLIGLPVADQANPLVEPVCNLAGCLLNFNCANKCSSRLVNAVERFLQEILMSALCDPGLVCCPDQDILRLETCLANPFVTGKSVTPYGGRYSVRQSLLNL